MLGFLTITPTLAFYYQFKGGQSLNQAVEGRNQADSSTSLCFPVEIGDSIRLKGEAAREHLEKAIELSPNQSYPYLLLGRTQCLLGEPANAIQSYLTYRSLRPNNPLGHLELGFALEANCLKEIDRTESHQHLAEGYEFECRDETFRTAILKEWRAANVSEHDFLEQGKMMRKRQRYQDALLWYGRAAALGGGSESEWWYTRYLQSQEKGNESEAYAALGKAVDLDSGWYDLDAQFLAWYQWGKWNYLNGRAELAASALGYAIGNTPGKTNLQPTLSEAYRFLGLAEWEQDNLEVAVENLQKAVQINPQNVWAHIHYGKVLYARNPSRAPDTSEQFAFALDLAVDRLEVWMNIIDFWVWVDEVDQANQLCKQALDHWRNNFEIVSRCST